MSDIASLCNSIMAHLASFGRTTASSMLPGLSDKEIAKLVGNLPFSLPRSAVELYRWSGGLDPQSDMANEFFPGFEMSSLEEMVAFCTEVNASTDFPRFAATGSHWFPLFRSSGVDFYCILCGDHEEADREIVFDDNEGLHRGDNSLPPVEFSNLNAMLRTINRAYEQGAYYIDSNGALRVGKCTYEPNGQLADVDTSEFDMIARTENPGVARWQ